ncbi:MAG: N-acetylmuramoyl-L-alanine amidase [Blautia sp.]|nr:N-acetylmuramoyl-L-alanine amidase [Blautia sp.]MCM1200517.1 N-acetylmuramoyl-L-alanine amidase [Bacteroides fragilis]
MKKRMATDRIQKFTISWFHREAGLFFFVRGLALLLTAACIWCCAGNAASVSHASETEAAAPDADEGSVVVVIDPGHGGENLGAEYEDYTEKEMTLIVARAMKEELEQYEGITVYLTRTGDEDLSLEERCEYAAGVNADFLFCLHFNMSEHHTLFGAETWISAFGEQYSRGYAFADIEIGLLQEMGLYSRGIKTRLNDRGEDYYGIIRHSRERNMPCVLIEHCHLDQENDQPFYDHQDKLEAFGRLDAEAVARYYGLKSESLGKDFSDYQNLSVPVPSRTVKPDSTEPDICMVELVNQNMENGEVTVSVSAADYDSGMLYYTYSYNGGMTFSELQRWPDKSIDTFEFTLTVPSGMVPQILINVYNGYDLYKTSDLLILPSMNYETEPAGEPEETEMAEDAAAAVESASDSVLSGKSGRKEAAGAGEKAVLEEPEPMTMRYFLQICLFCAALVFAMAFSMILILRGYKRKRRRRHR